MFSSLRQNNQVFILHKDNPPIIEVGDVVSVSAPTVKFNSSNFMNPQEYVVNIVVKVQDNTVTLSQLPANADVAEQANNLFVCTSKELLNNELNARKQEFLNKAKMHDFNVKQAESYDMLLQNMNPEVAEQKQQKQEIDSIKSQISELSEIVKSLVVSLKSDDTKPKENG